MATHTETPLAKDTLDGIAGSNAQGAALLGLSVDDDPKKIVTAIDEFVYAWQGGKRPSEKVIDPEDAPFALGSLWGQQIVRRFGWEWGMITFHQHNNTKAPGVLSPDRSLAIYPIHFLMGCLRDSGVDATILLSYNMIEAGKLGELSPGSYENLMDGVHRIVPRLPPGDAAVLPNPPLQRTGAAGWWSRILGLFGRGPGR